VNLIAVTAAGGMVDFRLKILDGEKAKGLLADKKNFPSLVIAEGNVILTASEDSQSQILQIEDGGNVFLLFPNSRNVVKPGGAVTVKFGDTVLEPVISK
jgi:hypothetical protein